MQILVWGLGYVGAVTAAYFANIGYKVIGVDSNIAKVNMVNNYNIPVKEPYLAEFIHQAVKSGRLRATNKITDLVPWGDLSLICVGTPSNPDGSTELTCIQNVAQDIGEGLRTAPSDHYHTVILRSSVFPGTTRTHLLPLLEKYSGRKAGTGFGLSVNPEFLREGSAFNDFYNPPYTIIGKLDERSGDISAALYEQISAPLYLATLEEAELLKLVNNAFHSLKVGFANEVGRLSESLGVDSHNIMNLVCADTKLNISPAYLQPGFAFGGSCLPKDLRSLTHYARQLGQKLPILDAILPSNCIQIEQAYIKARRTGAQHVTILGLSFKPGTDDIRESPIIKLIRDLWQDGVDITVYDPNINLDDMLGSNKLYLERQLPQIKKIFCNDLERAIIGADLLIISQAHPSFVKAAQSVAENVKVLDLVKLLPEQSSKLNEVNH